MPTKSSYIYVTFQREGMHRYPFADKDPSLATGDELDVSFLAFPHRHMFHFKVWISVNHNNRDIEFIQLKRWLDSLYGKGTLALSNKSCEMMAEDLHREIRARYPGHDIKIDVSEDGENGAVLEWLN